MAEIFKAASLYVKGLYKCEEESAETRLSASSLCAMVRWGGVLGRSPGLSRRIEHAKSRQTHHRINAPKGLHNLVLGLGFLLVCSRARHRFHLMSRQNPAYFKHSLQTMQAASSTHNSTEIAVILRTISRPTSLRGR